MNLNINFRPMKLSFALGASKKAGPSTSSKPPSTLKKPAAFGADDDENENDTLDAAPTASSSNASLDVNRRLVAQNMSMSTFGGSLSRAQKEKLKKEKEVDPTVYEYDEVYDKMKEAQAKVKAIKEDDPEARKVSNSLRLLLSTTRLLWSQETKMVFFVSSAKVYWESFEFFCHPETRLYSGRREKDSKRTRG